MLDQVSLRASLFALSGLFLSVPTVAQVVAVQRGYEIRHAGQSFASFKPPLLAGRAPTTSVQSLPDDWYRVSMQWRLDAATPHDDLAVDFAYGIRPDFYWVPHLSPFSGTVVAQHAFRSPAIIVADGPRTLALVPDLDLVGQIDGCRWYMDLDAQRRHAWIGIGSYALASHVFWVKGPGQQFPAGTVELAFFAKAYLDTATPRNHWAETSEFLWDRWGAPGLAAGQPFTNPMHKYVDTAYEWAFERWEQQVWLDGGSVGAVRFLVDFSESPTSGIPNITRRRPEVWNQAWYSSLRSASGMWRYAQRNLDRGLLGRANRSKRLALAAPVYNGIFPSVFLPQPEISDPSTFRLERSKWTNSDRSPRELGISPDWYHVLDASNTCLWMLRWYRELEQDPALLTYVRNYVDWLTEQQSEDGFFPAWLHPETLEPSSVLADSPETSRSASLLFEYADFTGDAELVQQGLTALDAVLAGPASEGRWEDFETYWSDNFFGRATFIGSRFPRNAMYKQNSFSMFWTAEACLAAYRATGIQSYLDWGVRTLDEMSMVQQVWQPPYMFVPTLGGFGVMNADGEWNDARQSLFAELFMDYYAITGNQRYFQRGIAALKASFAMMYTPLNPDTKTQWERARPTLGPTDYGFTMENYGHCGETNDQGVGIGFFTIFDWSCGSASEAYSRVTDHYGHVYIDETRGNAFGIDSIAVSRDGNVWRLTDLARSPRKIRVRFDDGRAVTLQLNGSTTVQ